MRIEKKCPICLRIRIETNADPQHWYRLICADPELTLCREGFLLLPFNN